MLMVLLFKEGAYILVIQFWGFQPQFFLYRSSNVLYLLKILSGRKFGIVHEKKTQVKEGVSKPETNVSVMCDMHEKKDRQRPNRERLYPGSQLHLGISH